TRFARDWSSDVCSSDLIPRNQIQATVMPGHDSGSVTLICEPESPAWSDWFLVDDGTNYENAEAITRAISRRVAEHRRGEKAAARSEERRVGKGSSTRST